MLRTILGLLVRTVEQFGKAQTEALGGQDSTVPTVPVEWGDGSHFEPKRWLEPYVHHRSQERWRTRSWSLTATSQTLCGWGRQRTRENFAIVPQASWVGVVGEQGGRGREGQAATWVLQRLYQLLGEVDPWLLANESFHLSDIASIHCQQQFLECLHQVHDELRQKLRDKYQWRGMGVALGSLFVSHQNAHIIRIGSIPVLRLRHGQLELFFPEPSTSRLMLDVSNDEADSPQESTTSHNIQPLDEPIEQRDDSIFVRSDEVQASQNYALGWGEGEAMVGSAELQHGDLFVMASQGFCDIVPTSVIRDVLTYSTEPLAKRCQRLIDIAYNTRFKHDDMTLSLLEVQSTRPPASRDTWKRWQGQLEEQLFDEG